VAFQQDNKEKHKQNATDLRNKSLVQTLQNGNNYQVQIAFWPTVDSTLDPLTRYDRLTQALVDEINGFVHLSNTNPKSVLCAFENYAYEVKTGKTSSSLTGLCEATGILKHKLHCEGYAIDLIPPSTIKSWFTGNGSAKKPDMWNTYEAMNTGVDLKTLIYAHCFRNEEEKQKELKTIPSPHSDIVDAFAIASCLTSGVYKMGKMQAKKEAVKQRKKAKLVAKKDG
jgi:Holliday junction resolvasome RuvABC endonuclease subunit